MRSYLLATLLLGCVALASAETTYDVTVENLTVGTIVVVPAVGGFLALILALILRKKVRAAPRGNDLMNTISDRIKAGSKQFLVTEYKYMTVFVLFFAVFLVLIFETRTGPDARALDGVRYAGCFLGGAILSALAGWIGMDIATDANVRTTQAASKSGLNAALQIAFAGGSVMGFSVVGLGIAGVVIFFLAMVPNAGVEGASDFQTYQQVFRYLAGFGFGASSIALFARVAGGIYTKAADVGADLVGKFENGLDEDSPQNPAVIADNVGDNVGDVAGMGADLFESYVGSIIAAGTLATSLAELTLPMWIAGVGILAAIIGSFFIKTKEGASQSELLSALSRGMWVAAFLVLGFAAVVIFLLMGENPRGWNIYGCIIIGLVSGVMIGEFTEYATSYAFRPVQSISAAGLTGSATVLIQGLGIGMLSCLPPVVVICIAIIACDSLAGGYGIAIAAVGMLSTLGVTLATDAYGPVADNAGGIAEMAELPEEVRAITDSLDALGNTTAATGKGFAIGSAVLTALSLLASFKTLSGLDSVGVDITEPIVLAGLLFGAVLPYVFAALTMLSVRKAAGAIISEVRRQFREIEGLREGLPGAVPESDKCIAISTKSSVEEMVLPGALAVLMPIFIGFMVGPKCLVGMLSGAISSGFMLAVMMSNAGGAWDNSKKYIEIEGAYGGKSTGGVANAVHQAAVVGDTVGDPFKDTSGPALNILIKLMSMVSLVIAPLLSSEDWATWYFGFIPLALMAIVTLFVWFKYWKTYVDPAAAEYRKTHPEGAAGKKAKVAVELTEEKAQAAPLKGDSI